MVRGWPRETGVCALPAFTDSAAALLFAVAPMPTELLIHATGVCALILNVCALVRRCERALRLHSGLSGVIWALNNLLLGAHTAAALSLLSAGRTATSAVTLCAAERVRHSVCAAFALLTVAIAALTWHGWSSALLLVASLISTFAVFYLRAGTLRLTMLLVSALWMVNAWGYDSWEQMLANVATALAALYGARRRAPATADPPPRTSTARSNAADSAS
jgi:hypothetical protein